MSANAFCLAAIAASTAACRAFARRARSFLSVRASGGGASYASTPSTPSPFSETVGANASVIVASAAPARRLSAEPARVSADRLGKSESPPAERKSRARSAAHSATSTDACESSSRQEPPVSGVGLRSASASRHSTTRGSRSPERLVPFETPRGDRNSAARYASRSPRSEDAEGDAEGSSAAFTSAIAEIPRSCRSAHSGRSRRKHSASLANVARETCLVKRSRRPNGSGGGGGARKSVAGDHAKVPEPEPEQGSQGVCPSGEISAEFSPSSEFSPAAAFRFRSRRLRTHSLVASASAASCSPREYRWKKASKPPSAQNQTSSRSAYDAPRAEAEPSDWSPVGGFRAFTATSASARSTSAASAATAAGRRSASAEKVTPLRPHDASWCTTSRRHRVSNDSLASQARSRVRETSSRAVARAHAKAPTGNEDGSGYAREPGRSSSERSISQTSIVTGRSEVSSFVV